MQRCNYRCAHLLNTCPKHTLSDRLLLTLPPLKLNAKLVSLNIPLCYRRAATALCLENNHWVASRQTLFKVQILFHLMWLYCIHLSLKGQNQTYGLHQMLSGYTNNKNIFLN